MAAFGQLIALLRRAHIDFDGDSLTLTPTTVVISGNLDIAGGITLEGDVQAGESGDAGTLISYPPTAAKGYLQVAAANAGGAFNTIVTNAAMGQTTTLTIPDPGDAAASFLLTKGAQTVSGVTTFAAKIEAELGISDADLILESLNALTINLNDVACVQLDNAYAAHAAAADTAGADFYLTGQSGGVDTSVDGGNAAGGLYITGGAGGAGGADMDGANAALLTIRGAAGGAGGAHTANDPNGGTGGSIRLQVGKGGAAGAAGSGVAGADGALFMHGILRLCQPGTLGSPATTVQSIDMADAAKKLYAIPGTPADGDVQVLGNILIVDPNSGDAGEDLLLPPEATLEGHFYIIVNNGGENVVVKDDSGGTTHATIPTTKMALALCDGTAWYVGLLT